MTLPVRPAVLGRLQEALEQPDRLVGASASARSAVYRARSTRARVMCSNSRR